MYHALLHRVNNQGRASSLQVLRDLYLSSSFKATNDTAGPSSLYPSLLFFGILSKLPYVPNPSLSHTTCLTAQTIAQNELETAIAKRCIQTSLSHQPPIAYCYHFKAGKSVYVYRKKERAWNAPHRACSSENKTTFVGHEELSGAKQFNFSRDKTAQRPSIRNLLPSP